MSNQKDTGCRLLAEYVCSCGHARRVLELKHLFLSEWTFDSECVHVLQCMVPFALSHIESRDWSVDPWSLLPPPNALMLVPSDPKFQHDIFKLNLLVA